MLLLVPCILCAALASPRNTARYDNAISTWHHINSVRNAVVSALSTARQYHPGASSAVIHAKVLQLVENEGVQLVDDYGYPLFVYVPGYVKPHHSHASAVYVASPGENGVFEDGRGDDLVARGPMVSIYLVPLCDGAYWAKYRAVSRLLLCVAALVMLTALACRMAIKRTDVAVWLLVLASTLLACAGWAWDGLLWSRSLLNSHGFILFAAGLLGAILLIRFRPAVVRAQSEATDARGSRCHLP